MGAAPVKFLPHKVGCEYGIGIHANVEDDALLVITPEAHVPHLDAQSGLWTRYDLSPGSSLVSVQLADLRNQAARPPTVGGRYTSRTRIHHAGGYQASDGEESAEGEPLNDAREGFVASDSLGHISTSCALPSTSSCGRAFAAEPSWQCDWTYGRRFKGLVMGTPTTNVIASIIISGPRSLPVSEKFRDLEGRHSHRAIGLLGDVHLAIQEKQLPSGAFTVVRAAMEGRDDMHRLLHHCLSPLQSALGHSPYGRYIRKSEKTTEQRMGTLFSPPFYVEDPSVEVDLAEPEATKEPPGLHIQRTS